MQQIAINVIASSDCLIQRMWQFIWSKIFAGHVICRAFGPPYYHVGECAAKKFWVGKVFLTARVMYAASYHRPVFHIHLFIIPTPSYKTQLLVHVAFNCDMATVLVLIICRCTGIETKNVLSTRVPAEATLLWLKFSTEDFVCVHVGYTVQGKRHSLSASVQVSLGGCYGDSPVGWSGALIMVAVCTEQYSSSSRTHVWVTFKSRSLTTCKSRRFIRGCML